MKSMIAKHIGVAALTLATGLAVVTPSQAVTGVLLIDGNSKAWVDVNSSAGMYQWTVDGINHLNQQWFWYRAGGGPQAPINSISSAAWYQTAPNKLNTTYANNSFSVEINYTLTGGGAGAADIDEGIKIHNFGVTPLTFTFYQYSDFNLLNSPGGDQVLMDNLQAYQWKGETQVAEGIVAPTASAYEANVTGGAGSTLFKLNNNPNLVLANVGYANGDVTWAFQWDFIIQPGTDGIITKDKLLNIYVIPEPTILALISLGLAGLLIRRRA
jgi:hypothetical protein